MKKLVYSSILLSTYLSATLIESSSIDPYKKGIAVGTFNNYSQASDLAMNFHYDDVYIKETLQKNYVVFLVNIEKANLQNTLLKVRNITPSAYITSDKRIKELSTDLRLKSIDTFNETPILKLKEENNFKEFSKDTQLFLDPTLVAFKLTGIKNKEEITKYKNLLPNISLFARKVFIHNDIIYDLYAVNINDTEYEKAKKDILTVLEEAYEITEIRIKYFSKNLSDEDLYFPKSTSYTMNVPIKPETLAKTPRRQVSTKKQNTDQIKIFQNAKNAYTQKNYTTALQLFQQLSTIDPSNTTYNFYLGRSYYELRQYDLASSAFERITIVDDKNLRAKLELAQTYIKLNLDKQALALFEEVKKEEIPLNVQKNIEKKIEFLLAKRRVHKIGGYISYTLSHDSNFPEMPNSEDDTKDYFLVSFQSLSPSLLDSLREGLDVPQKYSEDIRTLQAGVYAHSKLNDQHSFTNSLSYIQQSFSNDSQRLDDGSVNISGEEKRATTFTKYQLAYTYAYDPKRLFNMSGEAYKVVKNDKDYLQTTSLSFGYLRSFYTSNNLLVNFKYSIKDFYTPEDDPLQNRDSKTYTYTIGDQLISKEHGKTNLYYIYEEEKYDLYDQNNNNIDKKKHTIYLGNVYPLMKQLTWNNSFVYSLTHDQKEENSYLPIKEINKRIFSTGTTYYMYDKFLISLNLQYNNTKSNISRHTFDKYIWDFTFKYNF